MSKKSILGTDRRLKCELPHLDEAGSHNDACAIEVLFNQNVNHIWEKIFFDLDYETFKNCHKVCKEFNQVISSDHFQKKATDLFSDKMWLGQESLNIILLNQDIKDLWTYKDEEVAFTEFVGSDSSEGVLYYIDSNGSLHSTKLKRPYFSKIYILKHVIMLISYDGSSRDGDVLFVNKEDMAQSEVSFPEPCIKWHHIETRIRSAVYFAIYKEVNDERHTLWLGRISEDLTLNGHNLFKHKRENNLFVDQNRCCYVQQCDNAVTHPRDSHYGMCDFFSQDGTYYVSSNHRFKQKEKINITAHKLYKNKVRILWNKIINAFGHVRIRANSKYAVVLTPKSIVMITLSDGDLVKNISLWKNNRENRWLNSNSVISQNHLLVCRDRLPDEHGTMRQELLRLDLDTLDHDTTILDEHDVGLNIISMNLFNEGKLVALLENNIEDAICTITILNLSSSDLEEAFENRRVIYREDEWSVKNFEEVTKGVCGFQIKRRHCTRLGYISLKTVKIPLALDKFFSMVGTESYLWTDGVFLSAESTKSENRYLNFEEF